MSNLKLLLQHLMSNPWVILPSKLREIEAVLRDHTGGDDAAMKARLEAWRAEQSEGPEAAARRRERVTVGSIGIVPIIGTMVRRATWMMDWSGGVSTAVTAAQIDKMAAQDDIKGILLDIDSPGGSVDGTPELGDAIARAAKVKPVFANANGLAASGAYWVGSQATELAVSPSGMVGSIGVILMHMDVSKALENDGLKPTIIKAGRFKAEMNPYEPLSDEAKVEGQRILDTMYKQFVSAVAAGRGVSKAKVRDTFGEGRVVMADEALRKGMVDRVETINETLGRLLRRVARANGQSSRAQIRTVRDFEGFLRDAGDFSRSEATAVASSGFKAALDDAAPDEDSPRDGAAPTAAVKDEELGRLARSYAETVGTHTPGGDK